MNHNDNDFWWMVMMGTTAANQWGTNSRIEQSNHALEENNRLLEQIRRQLLTPKERAAEDARRKAEEAKRKAEYQMQGWITVITIVVLALFLIIAHS